MQYSESSSDDMSSSKNQTNSANSGIAPLPMTRAEMDQKGWEEVDVVFVTGDAYVDHPSFAAALLGRVLEADGFKVAILAQPDWHSAEAWTTFGKPRLCFCVSAGNMDSMINHYTANRKVRNDDAYSPDGQIGCRPDRATLSYCQRAREAYPGVTVITGGVEASLRRLAHYDYWSDKVKRSILMDSKADMLVYGMGETPLLEIMRGLAEGKKCSEMRDIRGTVYRLGASEDLPEEDENTLHLPSCEEVSENTREGKDKFSEMTKMAYENLNPYCAKRLVQEHGQEAIIVNPPSFPLSTEEFDRIYSLPFTRKPHPSYGKSVIPALNVVKNSVQILRGCFGGCAFCSLTAHQGKFVQSRSEKAICRDVIELTKSDDFKGTISDLGGPTANMYKLGCTNEQMRNECRRVSCLQPEVCPNLNTDHSSLISLMRRVREIPEVRQVFIASGVRTDLAQFDPLYLEELILHHVGGFLKTAPEHTEPHVLRLMNKPPIENYVEFCELFAEKSSECGKDQFLVPYMIAGLPGSDLKSMVRVAVFLHQNGIRPQQVQEFIPGPFELASSMYYTGVDPFTMNTVYSAHGLRERRLQKALLMYYDPEYYHDVKTALIEANRSDLIGTDPECLIPPYPSKMSALKQSSRIKRLSRKDMLEKQQKALYREEMQRQNDRGGRDSGRRSDRGDRSRGDRGPRSFDRSDRPARSFDRGGSDRNDRAPRSFDRSDRPARSFDRGGSDRNDRGPRSFDRSDRPARSFDRGGSDRNDRGPRSFDRSDRPARSFDRGGSDRNDRGPRSF
ncbi:MAG: YgiQ family radical SAM protein, partial [Thermoguttaceae bacterium]